MGIGAHNPRVHLGLHACQSPGANRYRGIARYVHDHALHLLRGHRELVGGVHIHRELPTPRLLADFCGYGLLREHPSDGDRAFGGDVAGDIFHIMSPFELGVPLRHLFPPPFMRAGVKLVVTLYDLIPLLYPEVYLRDPQVRLPYLRRLNLAREADHVLVISKATRDDAVRLLGLDPERITVIYGGVTDYFREPATPRDVARQQVMKRLPDITDPYILYTGGIDFRKNMEGAIAAYGHLPQRLRNTYQMVLVAHMLEPEKEALAQYARARGIDSRLILPGFAPDDLLRELYQACDLFVFPSLYEGLGLPILEAMRCGAPVIASDRSSTKELVEIDHARFNPEDSADVARVMASVLTNEDLRQELIDYGLRRSRQFTWDRVAQATAECYRAVASPEAERRSSTLARRRLVAFCTPFPPERSGVADYSRYVLETLCARHPLKVDVVVKGDLGSYVSPDHRAMSLVSPSQFRWLADRGHYDSIIYCMGNSPFHDYVYELLKEHRGIVWLHDVRLTDFYHWYYRQLGRDLTALPEELLPWARRYPDHENSLILRDILTQDEQGIYLVGEVASYAQKIVVNSRFSKELVELESAGRVPVAAIPLAAPPIGEESPRESWPPLAAKYRLDRSATVLVCIGIMGPTKCPEATIDGFAMTAAEAGNTVLAFIGPFDPAYRQELEHRISQYGIEDRVRFTGYVDDTELDSWLAKARCAMQLRFPSNGESSAAVMRCLAAGVPTIVTDHGPLQELPDDAVVKVPAPVEPDILAKDVLRILSDDNACEGLRRGALRYAQRVSFEAVADRFWSDVLCPP